MPNGARSQAGFARWRARHGECLNQGGFEPPTSRLSSVRSNQLSYGFRTNAKMQMKSGGPRPPRRKLLLGIPRNNLRFDWGEGEMCNGLWLCRLAARSVAGCGAVGHALIGCGCSCGGSDEEEDDLVDEVDDKFEDEDGDTSFCFS